ARGQESLRKKVAPSTGCSGNVFLIIHPFDYMAFECIHSLVVGPLLPSLSEFTDLDSVWVLWVPNRLTVWSRAEGAWQDVIFDWTDGSEPPRESSDLSVLQEAEVRFLDIRGDKGSSPFLFTISEGPERPED